MIKTNEFHDQDWGRCLLLQNEQASLTIPFDFGPRIVRYQQNGRSNLFGEFPAPRSDPDKSKWHSYGVVRGVGGRLEHHFRHQPGGRRIRTGRKTGGRFLVNEVKNIKA